MIGYLNDTEEKAVKELKEKLIQFFGDRLKKMILYGSKARGDFYKESDIDLLIIVNDLDADAFDIITETTYKIELKYDLEISVSPYSTAYYQEHINNRINLFMHNIKVEGVAV